MVGVSGGGARSAAECLQVDVRRSTLPPLRLVRTLVANGLAAVYSGDQFNWPPTDVVVVDRATGRVCGRWHEHGNAAAVLREALDDDLVSMDLEAFAEKWGVTPPEAGPGPNPP